LAKVERGLISLTGTTVSVAVDLSDSVPVGESYVISSARADSDSGYCSESVAKVELTTVDDGNYTKIEATRGDGANNCYVEWQVITGSEFTVQSGGTSFSDGIVPKTEPIDEVTASKSFITVSASSTAWGAHQSFVRAKFNSTEEIELRPSAATTSYYPVASWYVVEWDGATVQSGTVDNTGITNTAEIDAVVLAETFLSYSYYATNATRIPNVCFSRGRFSSTEEVEFRRGSSTNETYVSFFVVSHDDISVQSDEETISGGSTTQTLSNAVDTSATFLSTPNMGGAYQDSGGTGNLEYGFNSHKLFQDGDDSKVTIEREATTGTLYASWFAVEVEVTDVDVNIIAPVATGTAQAITPTVTATRNITVSAPVATATGQAPLPTVFIGIPAPVLSGEDVGAVIRLEVS